jgi:hypothetical protein
MKNRIRLAVVILAGLLVTMGVRARPSGPGGGHGGPGGHGGGGHSSGLSSGRGAGHAMGHSFGHLFGRHGKASNSGHDMAPPLAGAAVVHGKIVQLPGPQTDHSPAQLRSRHRPIDDFPFGERFLLLRHRRGFGFGGCAGFGFPRRGFFFDNNFDCFGGGFFFDLFLMAGLSGEFIGGQAFLPVNDQDLENSPDDSTAWPPTEAGSMQPSGDADFGTTGGNTQNTATNDEASANITKNERPLTLLQLRDGSMYGLVDYWVEDDRLHYKTSYGAQNSIELDRIDLEQTVRLNADRGVQFVLRPKHPSASVPPTAATPN